eukprot:scaffold90712_cov20-Tisochrysis_lutea.AAC.1
MRDANDCCSELKLCEGRQKQMHKKGHSGSFWMPSCDGKVGDGGVMSDANGCMMKIDASATSESPEHLDGALEAAKRYM